MRPEAKSSDPGPTGPDAVRDAADVEEQPIEVIRIAPSFSLGASTVGPLIVAVEAAR